MDENKIKKDGIAEDKRSTEQLSGCVTTAEPICACGFDTHGNADEKRRLKKGLKFGRFKNAKHAHEHCRDSDDDCCKHDCRKNNKEGGHQCHGSKSKARNDSRRHGCECETRNDNDKHNCERETRCDNKKVGRECETRKNTGKHDCAEENSAVHRHTHKCEHDREFGIECGCGHDHGKSGRKPLPQWVLYVRMGLAALLLAIGAIIEHAVHSEQWAVALFAVANVIIGYDIYIRMFKNIIKGRIFDENFLMIVAAIAAFVIGEGLEGVMVLLLYQVGETLQDRASDKSTRAIGKILDIRADKANVEVGDSIAEVNAADVKVGDIVVIKAGERIPLDGTVIEGASYINTVALTGESVPRKAVVGDEILAGCINTGNAIRMRVDKIYSESTASKIVATVKNINKQKSGTEKFITRFAKYYTPVVVLAAFLMALIPSLMYGNSQEWIYRAITFLVISCPCALVISVPMSYFGGIGSASKRGILIKGGVHIDSLAAVKNVVMDKTGTLTKGVFTVSKIVPRGVSEEQLLEYAAQAEFYSNHPIAKAVTEYVGVDGSRAKDISEIAGQGIIGTCDGKPLLVGNDKLMRNNGIVCEDIIGTAIHVAFGGEYYGYVIISDIVKDDARESVSALHKLGVKVTMLTGDNENAAAGIAREVGIDDYYSELLPLEKVEKLNSIMAGNKGKNGTKTVFVGDGINDTPVLVVADVGIAMGGLGADAAIESADAVIMNDEPKKIVTAIRISKKTKRIVFENIIFSLGVKLIVLILGGWGIASIWLALFADVGVSVLAVFNALRTLRLSEKRVKQKSVRRVKNRG